MKLSIAQAQPADVLRYDYSLIADEDERAVVISAAMTIKPLIRRTAEDLVRLGHELIGVKDYLPHGQFTAWLQTEFDMHPRTARRMMAVAERLGHKMDTLSVLAPSVLYELAADSTPHDVVEKVEAAIVNGAPPSTREVRNMVIEAQRVEEPATRSATRQDVLAALDYIAETADVLSVDTHWLLDYANTYLRRKDIVVDKDGLLIDGIREWRAQALEEMSKPPVAPAPASVGPRALDDTETQALIARVLEKDFDTEAERLKFVTAAGPDRYAHALRADRYINSETFETARFVVRADVAKRAAEEARDQAKEQAARQEQERLNAIRHDKQTMLYGLTRALAELPEAAEDTYYDLTGTTLYSAARQAIANAIRELENTMEAKRA